MTSTEHNIDKIIRAALNEEELQAYDDLGEQGIVDMAFGAFSGRNKALSILMMFMAAIFFGLAVYSVVQFFNAEATKDLIMWASGFFFFMMGTTAMKVWWWMEMEKNATVREIKRVELQIANLTALITERTSS